MSHKLPTPRQMKKFAAAFSQEEWNTLCENQSFLAVFTENLTLAKALSIVILGKI
jgi:hypothetical protein